MNEDNNRIPYEGQEGFISSSANSEGKDLAQDDYDLENTVPQPYQGETKDSQLKNDNDSFYEADDGEMHNTLVTRQQSLIERVQSKYSFFNERLQKNRLRLYLKVGFIYILMSFLILAIFSIYWGSFYHRNTRLKNLNMLVVIEDDKTIDGVEPFIGNTIKELVNSDMAKKYGKWHVFDQSEFQKQADKHDNNIEAEVLRQIHHQKYWSSIYVKPNATYNLYEAISNGDLSYNATNNTIVSHYETGRDFLSMNLYVTPSIRIIEQMWLAKQANVSVNMTKQLPSSSKSDILTNPDSISVLSTPLHFQYEDRIPYTDPVLTAPSQVGLIYMIIITFFQVNFFQDLNQEVATFGLKPRHYVAYRLFLSIFSFFVISLSFSLVTLAFQVDFTKAYGKSGFLVYWMISFITMWAVGLVNEIMALLCIILYPPLIGFWMLFWVIINIAPTFAPIVLSPQFFRYGYAMPILNSYEATKVVLFNTYKGNLGRNFGILAAWIVLATTALPFVLKFFAKVMGKRAAAAAAAKSRSPSK